MAGRPKIGSEIDLANRRKKSESQMKLRKEQAAASSHFNRGTISPYRKKPADPILTVIVLFILTVKKTPVAASHAETEMTYSSAAAPQQGDKASTKAVIVPEIDAISANLSCESSFVALQSSVAATAKGAVETSETAPTIADTASAKVAVMCGLSKVLSEQQLKDAEYAVKRVKESSSWPFSGSWYFPPTGPKLSEISARDPNKYFSIPVLLIMPVQEFPNRFNKCPCARFGYNHKRVNSNGYTEPCRVVGIHYTYAMVGNRYICLDCKEISKDSDASTYTFNSYDERVLSYLPPDVR